MQWHRSAATGIQLEQIRHLRYGRSQLEQPHHVHAVEVANGRRVRRHHVGSHHDFVALDQRTRLDSNGRRDDDGECRGALQLIEGPSHLAGVAVRIGRVIRSLSPERPVVPPGGRGQEGPRLGGMVSRDLPLAGRVEVQRMPPHRRCLQARVNRHGGEPCRRQRLFHAGGRQRVDEGRRISDEQPVVARVLAGAVRRGVPTRRTRDERRRRQ